MICIYPSLFAKTALDFKLDENSGRLLRSELDSFPFKNEVLRMG